MRVLVTGGAGYIGSLVVRQMLDRGWSPVVLDNMIWGAAAIEDVAERIEIVDGDCRNSRDLLKALKGVDAVVHLAGLVGDPACKSSPDAHFTTNIESTRTLINCCTDVELDLVRDVVFVSSCSVYGNVRGIYDEVTEEATPSPLSTYAHAKLRCEEALFSRMREVPHFHPTILRLTTVFGWSPRPRFDLVTNMFVHQGWKGKPITVQGGGGQYRSLIHVHDVARAIVETLARPRFVRSGRVFHVGEETNNKTIREIAELVAGNVPGGEVRFVDEANADRRDYRINCSRIRNATGWQARYSVKDGIVELLGKLNDLDLDWEAPKYRNNSRVYD